MMHSFLKSKLSLGYRSRMSAVLLLLICLLPAWFEAWGQLTYTTLVVKPKGKTAAQTATDSVDPKDYVYVRFEPDYDVTPTLIISFIVDTSIDKGKTWQFYSNCATRAVTPPRGRAGCSFQRTVPFPVDTIVRLTVTNNVDGNFAMLAIVGR